MMVVSCCEVKLVVGAWATTKVASTEVTTKVMRDSIVLGDDADSRGGLKVICARVWMLLRDEEKRDATLGDDAAGEDVGWESEVVQRKARGAGAIEQVKQSRELGLAAGRDCSLRNGG